MHYRWVLLYLILNDLEEKHNMYEYYEFSVEEIDKNRKFYQLPETCTPVDINNIVDGGLYMASPEQGEMLLVTFNNNECHVLKIDMVLYLRFTIDSGVNSLWKNIDEIYERVGSYIDVFKYLAL